MKVKRSRSVCADHRTSGDQELSNTETLKERSMKGGIQRSSSFSLPQSRHVGFVDQVCYSKVIGSFCSDKMKTDEKSYSAASLEFSSTFTNNSCGSSGKSQPDTSVKPDSGNTQSFVVELISSAGTLEIENGQLTGDSNDECNEPIEMSAIVDVPTELVDTVPETDVGSDNVQQDEMDLEIQQMMDDSFDEDGSFVCAVCCEWMQHVSPISVNPSDEVREPPFVSRCPVCLGNVCLACQASYLNNKIYYGLTRIYCPGTSCTRVLTDIEIERHAPERAVVVYRKNKVELENDPRRKTCPGCSRIHAFTEATLPKKVICSGCNLHWCVPCYAPWHENMTCKQFQNDINNKQGRKALKSWAKSKGTDNANARKCPKCKFFIERISGCDHMTCARCQTDFCYRCGKKHFSAGILGDHYSRYSFLGCKYNLLPGKPFTRVLIRSSVVAGWVVLSPVAACVLVSAGGLLVVSSPCILSVLLAKKLRRKYH